jgi:RNA polymerase sigma factor (sigma-70 family)
VPRVDYSELVDALQDGDESRAAELLDEVIPRLEDYLQVVLGADPRTARECVHQAFLDVLEQIRKDNIREDKYIFSYLIKACRHEFIRYQKHQHRFLYEEESVGENIQPAMQIKNLLDEEREKILKQCLDELDKKSKAFITHFMREPDTTTKEASDLFKISEANVRTRKSRITNQLHECYKRKSRQ